MAQHAREHGNHRRPVRGAFWSAVSALVVTVVGCAGPGAAEHPAAGPGTSGPVPALLRSADLRLPLDGYIPSIADAGRLARASRLLVRQCMAELGFTHYAVADPAPAGGPRTWNERRYGLSDPAQAARGYWPQSRTPAAAPAQDAITSPAEGSAVTGRVGVVNGRRVPSGGCGAEAQRRLRADDPPGTDRYLSQQLSYQSFAASQRDARVRAVFGAWSGCMRAAGFVYGGPLDPPADRRFQGRVTGLEIATAKADVACKRQTNLVGVWFAVESAQQRSLIEANRAALELARTAFTAELAIAAGVGA